MDDSTMTFTMRQAVKSMASRFPNASRTMTKAATARSVGTDNPPSSRVCRLGEGRLGEGVGMETFLTLVCMARTVPVSEPRRSVIIEGCILTT